LVRSTATPATIEYICARTFYRVAFCTEASGIVDGHGSNVLVFETPAIIVDVLRNLDGKYSGMVGSATHTEGVIATSRGYTRHRGAVIVVRSGRVWVVVSAIDVVPDEIPSVDIINKAVPVIVSRIAGRFAAIDEDVVGEVLSVWSPRRCPEQL
jgi:hypothetical protein